MAGIKIKGLEAVLKKVRLLDEGLQDEVKAEVQAGAYDMNSAAQKNIQAQGLVDEGFLINSQNVAPKGENTWTVYNAASYAPYHEFGTGGMVKIDPDWKEIAAQFKGKGVRVVNIKPRPFLVPAFNQVGAQIVKRIENVIKDAIK